MMNVIFFGTPDFVIPVADSILKTKNLKLVAVVTNPDRPAGRSQILTPSPIKQWAAQHDISVLTPDKLDHHFKFKIKDLKLKIGILAAYGKIIPQEVIDLFPKGILVIHPSLLPKYRGASPVQAAIVSGDKETGVSIIQMDEKIDHGPIVAQFKYQIKPTDTTQTLLKYLIEEAAATLIKHLNLYLKGKLKLKEQNHSRATYTKLITREDGFIPPEFFLSTAIKGNTINNKWPIRWFSANSSYSSFLPYPLVPNSSSLFNFIRAMIPWPGAFTHVTLNTKNQTSVVKRLKILKTHLKVLSVESSVLCLDKVQLEGKKSVTWSEFQKVHPNFSLVKRYPGRELKRRG